MSPALLSAAPFSGISLTVFMQASANQPTSAIQWHQSHQLRRLTCMVWAQGKLWYKEYTGVSSYEAAPVHIMLGLQAI